jgi:flagellar biosynthesis/type III secretory pathway protein FliH
VSFHLAYVDDGVLLDSSRPVVKAYERTAFADAVSVLVETRYLRERAQADAEAARNDGRRAGLDEAKAESRHAIAAGLADIARNIDAHAESRRADIAEAAFAAAHAIVGELDKSEAMRRVVDRTLARLDTETPVTIDVAPVLAAELRTHVAALNHVSITENPDLGPTDCHIVTASGRIIASLSVQFDALAARWGLKKEEAAHADG